MGHAVFVFGPAGAGKSTFCRNMQEHGRVVGRNYKVVNLDPAQASVGDEYTIDLRDFITVNEVMESYDYGPNGGLMAALEELYENMDEFELEELEDFFLIFDCPGQIELFMHSDVMSKIIRHVEQYFRCGVVYMMESQYLTDINKYINGCFCALISMSRLSVPCINIISKADLIEEDLEMFCMPSEDLMPLLGSGKYSEINRKILEFVLESSMTRFYPLDWNKEDCIEEIVYYIDNALQYYDDVEPKLKDS